MMEQGHVGTQEAEAQVSTAVGAHATHPVVMDGDVPPSPNSEFHFFLDCGCRLATMLAVSPRPPSGPEPTRDMYTMPSEYAPATTMNTPRTSGEGQGAPT